MHPPAHTLAVALEENEARKVVRFALEVVGDLRLQRLLALLKDAKQLAVRRELVVPRFMQLEKFCFDSRTVWSMWIRHLSAS
jgi:hypothetical protein